jgi:hypothetical protein
MRLSDAGMRCRHTKLIYLNHRLPPWPTGDDTRDRSNRWLDLARRIYGVTVTTTSQFELLRSGTGARANFT